MAKLIVELSYENENNIIRKFKEGCKGEDWNKNLFNEFQRMLIVEEEEFISFRWSGETVLENLKEVNLLIGILNDENLEKSYDININEIYENNYEKMPRNKIA